MKCPYLIKESIENYYNNNKQLVTQIKTQSYDNCYEKSCPYYVAERQLSNISYPIPAYCKKCQP